MNCRALVCLLAVVGYTSTAEAQDDWSSPLLQPPPPTPLQPAPSTTPELPADYAVPQAPPRPSPYDFKIDLALEVPIPLTDEHNSSGTGIGFSGAFGWDLGYFVPTVNLGWAWNPLNVPAQFGDDRTLTRFHMGLGLVLELDNDTFVVPVLGAMLDLNWWHVSGDTAIACGGFYYWGCYAYNRYDYTTGFTFKVGLDFRFPKHDQFSIGLGALPAVTLSGGPFQHAEWWISPYVMFTIRG